jgi:His-Xaa-Ser system radical SAM maturase HxsC
MIPLRLKIATQRGEPFIVRLNDDRHFLDATYSRMTSFDAQLEEVAVNAAIYATSHGPLHIYDTDPTETHGDVLFVVPDRKIAHRFIRASSPHNTFLVTERCDQLCVMCSQPPKENHVDMFPHFEAAALLTETGKTIGISGGEPLLYKDQLFGLLKRVLTTRPDLRFHILTNGQQFCEEDTEALSSLPRDSILWGIPLYSHKSATHDEIVGKQGAYVRLLQSLAILARTGSAIELRTVIMQPNAAQLPSLARFISSHVPFISVWAIMQLENIGYGRQNWDQLFFDNSTDFAPIASAMNLVRARGMEARLYNFPLCTVPSEYRELAPPTISDWKRAYPDLCEPCSKKTECSGFFEWHPHNKSYEGVRPI